MSDQYTSFERRLAFSHNANDTYQRHGSDVRLSVSTLKKLVQAAEDDDAVEVLLKIENQRGHGMNEAGCAVVTQTTYTDDYSVHDPVYVIHPVAEGAQKIVRAVHPRPVEVEL